jgi:hypothetical protein
MIERALSQALRQHGITEPLFELIPTDGVASLWAVRVQSDAAVSLWQALRAIVAVTHHWPVMIDPEMSFEGSEEPLSNAEIRECLERAETEYREIVQWGVNPLPRRPDVGAVLAPLVGRGNLPLAELVQSLARAPMVSAATEIEAPPSVLEHPPDDPPHVLQIPKAAYTPISWEYVSRSYAVSFLRRLDELFGVELVGMTHELIELRVARPPADERSARIMSKLLLGPDEGNEVEKLIRARWVSLWCD